MSATFGILVVVMVATAIFFVTTPMFRLGRPIGSAGIAAALPLFAIGLYLTVGSPEAAGIEPPQHPKTSYGNAVSSPKSKSPGSVASLVDGLAKRLEENPDDGKSWLLLARSYEHLKRLPEAKSAYEHAAALGQYDETLASLTASPQKSVMLGAATPRAQVRGRVELSRESENLAAPDDTVFVFARAIGGPAVPVAVLRKPASALPFDFGLDDSHSMTAEAKLSNYERVIVTARITRAGDARNALRGLQADSGTLVVADHDPVTLVIDSQE